MTKRLLSILLIVCMLLTMLPVSALAAQSAGESTQISNPFADVKASDWYFNAVQYARVNGFFGGVSKDRFAPQGTMTRGMFVTVLGRMAGVDPANYTDAPEFSDVAADAWYAPYVQWAAKYGITTGIGGGKFAPERLISREEMAVFFVRYLTQFGVTVDTGANYDTLPSDLEEISSWAREAVLTLWKTGLLAGSGGRFDPRGNASRAQAATLCMRMDKGVDTWYSEPGVPSTRVSIDPADETAEPEAVKKPSSGTNSGTSGGTTVTTYYEVSFALGEGQDDTGVTLPNAKTVASGTKISALPTPYVTDGLFAGWYYDAEMKTAAGGNEPITSNLTLYARIDRSEEAMQVTQVATAESPNSVTDTVEAVAVDDYTFAISDYTGDCIESFVNVTANNAEFKKTSDSKEQYRYTVSGDTVSPVLEAGQTYRVELAEDFEGYFVIGGLPQPQSVRVLSIITEKLAVDELKLDSGMKYIEKSQVSGLGELNGLFTATLSADGSTAQVDKIAQSGTFTYAGGGLAVGDTVAIYEGMRPDQRTDRTIDSADDGAIAYVEITGINGDVYSYRTADAEDVLFTPDVLPVSDTYKADGTATVPRSEMDFTDDKYAEMGLSSQTSIDVGDFLLFYSGDFDQYAKNSGYGKITDVSTDGDDYVIAYTDAEEADVLAAMDVYTTREVDVPDLTDEQIEEMAADMERQARESGFAEEAAQYLTSLAVQTDGFRQLSDDVGLTSYAATYTDGTPVQQSDIALYSGGSASILDKDKLQIKANINAGSLVHFDGSYGLRAELTMSFTVEVQSKNSANKLVIEIKATFEQEIMLSVNTSGGAVWKKAWIFPYIADYQLNANLDLGLYTGVGIVATARFAGDEDDDDPFEGLSGRAVEIGKQIRQLMDDKEHFLGEDIEMNTVGGGLAEKYAGMMENAEESWIELFRKEIYSKEGPVDRLHILVYGISADFVVSANLYVTLGMSFEYEAAKRYTFSLKLFSRSVTNGTVDLVTPHYNFDFYVMGTVGIRAGVEFEIGIGLFSLKLDSIGITAETGVYARMWGYFYYHLEWEKGKGKESNASGAMFVEIGVYLKITFKAQLFSSDKLTYQPTLYENEWPLWSAGAQQNVYDFAYDDDDESLNIEIMGVREAALPSSLFDMNYMDMKTGELYGTDADDEQENPAQNYDDASESHYTIELSDSDHFSYDPTTNTITVTPDSTSVAERCEMTIRWKNGALAFTSKPIERTVTIDWTDPENLRFIAFNTQGGSLVRMLALVAGAPVEAPDDPTKTGYTFGGWYADAACTTAFTFPDTMPDYENTGAGKGVTVYAKWEPRHDTKYTVEHYQQQLNGTYALYETVTMTGTTDSQTDAEARSYGGFRSKSFSQKAIAPDGSTVVKIYYAREKYNITFRLTEDPGDDGSVVTVGRYGATVYAPKFARSGYQFEGYTGGGIQQDENDNWYVYVTGNAACTAEWSPSNDIAYRVEHYVRRVSGAGYLLYDGDNAVEYHYDGRTGETVGTDKLAAIPKLNAEGLTYDQATTEEKNAKLTIGADGKTVIKIYYNRAGYTVFFKQTDGKLISEAAYVHDAKVVEPAAPTKQGYTFGGWFTDVSCQTAYDFGTKLKGDLTLYAKWVASSDTEYTARYFLQNVDGSYPDQPQSETLHGTTGATATLSKTFDGYHADAEHDGTATTGTIAADGSLVLTAYFARNTYTVTFKDGDKTVSEATLRWGETLTVPTLTKAGYDLSWSPALPGDRTMPQQDVTYTAVWTAKGDIPYTVKHYQQNAADDGYTLADTDNLTGTTDAAVTAAAKSYDYFTLNETASTMTGTVAANGSLTLELYYDRDTVELTFDPNGGTLAQTVQTLRYGAPLSSIMPTWDDYHAFAGWFNDKNEQVTTVPAAAATLYAKWTFGEVNYTVEHYVMGTDGQYPATATKRDGTRSGTVDSTVTLADLKDSTLEAANGITYAYATVDGATVTETTVASGKVVKLFYTRKSFSVTFEANGGELADNIKTLYYGASLSGITPTRTNYTFTGWYDTAAATGTAATTVPAASGDSQTFYAGWSANNVEFTVKHYVQNVTGDDYTMQLQESKQAAVDSSIAPADYKSDTVATADGGIYYDCALKGGETVTALNVEAGMTLVLHYARKTSQLTWNCGDGTVKTAGTPAGTVRYGQTITAPTLERTGYTYEWDPEVAETVGVENLTYTAVWTANSYTVSFDANDGKGQMETQGLTYDKETTLIENAFTRAGYEFTGWNTARDGKGTAYADKASVSNLTATNGATVTLYAQWQIVTYTITYQNADNTDVSWAENFEPVTEYDITDVTDHKITLPGAEKLIAPAAKVFGGWYDNAACTGDPVTEIPAGSTGNKTFYARWEEEKNEFVFVDNEHVLATELENIEYTPGRTDTPTPADGICADSDDVFLYWYYLDGTTEMPMAYAHISNTMKGRVELYPKVISTTIKTADDLKALHIRYNYKALEGSYTFKLDGDLDMAEVPAAIGTSSRPFDQTFDGNGHTILMNGTAWPLFSYVGETGTVKDLTISLDDVTANPVKQYPTGWRYWGAVAAENSGTIENCTVFGEVLDITEDKTELGGIVGHNSGGTVKNCRAGLNDANKLTIGNGRKSEAATSVGGLVGSNAGTVTLEAGLTHNVVLNGNFSCAGGLIAVINNKSVTITGNTINSSVLTFGKGNCGGLIGSVASGGTLAVENCTITSDVRGFVEDMGGLIGIFEGTNLSVTGNTITVNEISQENGDLGRLTGGLIGCVDQDNTTVTVKNNAKIAVTIFHDDFTREERYFAGLIAYITGSKSVIDVSENKNVTVKISGVELLGKYSIGGMIGVLCGEQTLTMNGNKCEVEIQYSEGATSGNIGGMAGAISGGYYNPTPVTMNSNTLDCTISAPNWGGAMIGSVVGELSGLDNALTTVSCSSNTLKGSGITFKEGNKTVGLLVGWALGSGGNDEIGPKWNDIALYKVDNPLSIDKSGWTVSSTSFKQPANVIGSTATPAELNAA